LRATIIGVVRRRGEADNRIRVEVGDGAGERRAGIAVGLVGEDKQVVEGREVVVEAATETLLVGVGLAALLRGGSEERLHGEDIDLDATVVVEDRPHGRGVEVVGGDEHRFGLHRLQQALAVAGREVGDRLVADRVAGRDDGEVPVSACGGEILDAGHNDVGLSDARG